MVVLRPLLVTRLANTLPGLWGGCFGAAASATYLPLYTGLPAALLVFAAGVIVAVRGYLMAVEVDANWVTVRGLFRSRRVPRSALQVATGFPAPRWVSVTRCPALAWVSPTGRPRWTPLIMFMNAPRQLKKISEHNRRSIATLRQALRRPE